MEKTLQRRYCPACQTLTDPHACYFRQSYEGDLQEEIGALLNDARLLTRLQSRLDEHEQQDAFHLQQLAEELLKEASRRLKTLTPEQTEQVLQ